MVREKECLLCKQNFAITYMVRGQQTNSYGDKITDGWLCNNCYSKRVQKRTKILIWGSYLFLLVGGFIYLIMILFVLSAVGNTQADYELIIEIYFSFGGLFFFFGLLLFFIRKRELDKVEKLLKIQ